MGKARLDGKVVELEVSKYEETSGMYVRTCIRKPRKYSRNSEKTDVEIDGYIIPLLLPFSLRLVCILGETERAKNASRVNATYESRAIPVTP